MHFVTISTSSGYSGIVAKSSAFIELIGTYTVYVCTRPLTVSRCPSDAAGARVSGADAAGAASQHTHRDPP